MGIYIIFNIVSPFINNQDIFNIENIDMEKYALNETEEIQVTSEEVDQTSMNKRIKDLYVEELQKDITKKVEEQGYKVNNCEVKVSILDEENETEIKEIKLKVEKSQKIEENKEDAEDRLIEEIQKIKEVDTTVNIQKKDEEKQEEQENNTISKSDIQNIKKFLIEEYEVNEKCLKIN